MNPLKDSEMKDQNAHVPQKTSEHSPKTHATQESENTLAQSYGPSPAAPSGEVLLNTLRLLYVEDDQEALEELAHFLKKRVAVLSVASNGAEALELCRRQTFDVMLCDLWMPVMDGFTLIQTLRAEGNQTPVIITSAFSDLETILKAIDLGIVKYCVKPIDEVELLGSLQRIALEKLTHHGELILSGSRLVDRQQRLELEKALKSAFAHLLKNLTGKGPREVRVTLGASEVEIWATEVLSPIESALLSLGEHSGAIPYLRKALYTGYHKRFEALLEERLSASVTLEEVRVHPAENTDWLRFKVRPISTIK